MPVYFVDVPAAIFLVQGLQRPAGRIHHPDATPLVHQNGDCLVAPHSDLQDVLGMAQEIAHAKPYRPEIEKLRR